MVRDAACAGYDADTLKAKEPRERLQQVITAVVDRTAEELEAHFRLDNASQNANHDEARTYAKCLGYACSSYYFGSGAFPERVECTSPALNRTLGKEDSSQTQRRR